MGAPSQAHSGQGPPPYQRSRIPQAGSPADTAYSLRLGNAEASGSPTTRPMLVRSSSDAVIDAGCPQSRVKEKSRSSRRPGLRCLDAKMGQTPDDKLAQP